MTITQIGGTWCFFFFFGTILKPEKILSLSLDRWQQEMIEHDIGEINFIASLGMNY